LRGPQSLGSFAEKHKLAEKHRRRSHGTFIPRSPFPLFAPRQHAFAAIRQRRMLRASRGGQVRSMAKVVLASSLTRWLPLAQRGPQGELSLEVEGGSVDQALNSLFRLHPSLRGYVLDEQGRVRHHVAVIVDGEAIRDKRDLRQPLGERGELYIMQALSGG
jgi:sulfur-carrier protein